MRAKVLAIVLLLVVALGAVVGALGGFSGLSLGGGTATATTFLTATASVATVTDAVSATGSIAAVETWSLAFGSAPAPSTTSGTSTGTGGGSGSVAWPVTELTVAVGDAVKEGDVLATADSGDLEAAITQASRNLSSADLQLAQAKSDKAAATTTAQVRQTTQSLYNAETQVDNATATLAALKAQRDYERLVAPVDGIVTAVAVRVGQDASGTAITLQSSALQVTTNVTESDISRITIGQKAEIAVSAVSATLQGTVTAISPTPSSSGGSSGVVSYPVTIVLDAPPTEVRVGMTADVTITIDQRSNVLSIPARALSGSSGAYTVRVIATDGTVSTVSVQVGLVTSSLAEITGGLTAGERVVTGTSSTQQTTTTTRTQGGQGFPGTGAFGPRG
jgi:macrolide-specific efflux system membrane fusion protein